MFLRWSAYLLPCLGSCVVSAVSAVSVEVCEETSSHQPQDGIRPTALMQRKKERRVVAPFERDGGPRSVQLFLSEMEGLAHRKGIDGLDPEEVQHVQTIKDLIADTIIPSILDGAEEARQEIAELYEAIINCTARATGELEVESTMHTDVENYRDDHKECRKLEDDTIKEKNRICQQFNITRTSIELPSGEMPSLEATDATMIQYLKDMNEYFCGRMQVFKDEWDECEELTKNYTDIHDRCVVLQQDLEESWCTWMTELDGTCGGMSECWESTVARFNERKAAIEQLVEDRKEALQGALKVQCLWDAWEWDREPCTVNETKLKECNDLQPNTSAIEVDIPSPPHRHPCNMSAEGYFPCSEAFIGSEYGSLDVSQALIDEMRDACSACPPQPTPGADGVCVPGFAADEGVDLGCGAGTYRGEEIIQRHEPILESDAVEHVEGTRYKATTSGPVIMENVRCATVTLHDVTSRTSIFWISGLRPRFASVAHGQLDMTVLWDSAPVSVPVKAGDVVSMDLLGDKMIVKLDGKLVKEEQVRVPQTGVFMQVQVPAGQQVDVAFGTIGVYAGVPYLFQLECAGPSTYRMPEDADPRAAGHIDAKDVLGMELTVPADGNFMVHIFPTGQGKRMTLARLAGKWAMSWPGIETPEFEANEVLRIDASGEEITLKYKGSVMYSAANTAPPTGLRSVMVHFRTPGMEMKVTFDYGGPMVEANAATVTTGFEAEAKTSTSTAAAVTTGR